MSQYEYEPAYAPSGNPKGLVNSATGFLTSIADRALEVYAIKENAKAQNRREALVPTAVEMEVVAEMEQHRAVKAAELNKTVLMIGGGILILGVVLFAASMGANRRRR